ncbi:MAG: S49 family peptidase [Spirochaetes bacterium]|nr:S49 family peptidase [Spirochaetota bacterium]
MLRALFLALVLPLRLFFYAIVKIRARHRGLLYELTIKADFTEAPLSHGIWSYFKPAKDRFYLLALELAAAVTAVEQKKIKLQKMRLIIEPHNLGWAQAWELRDLVKKFRATGVRVETYLLADDKISAFIASGSDKIVSPETAAFDFSPFTSESLFVQNLLTKLGIRPQFMSVGEFKSAAEMFTRTGMSPAARRQTEELIADIEREFFAAVAERAPALGAVKNRKITGAAAARALKFVDTTLSLSEFRKPDEADEKLTVVDSYRIDKLVRRKNFRLFNFRKPPRIALVVAEGNIIESAESRPGTINWPDYEQVSDILAEEDFAAVLLRVNSPGGSALVSQLIWREWMLAAGKLEPETTKKKKLKEEEEKKHATEKKTIPGYVSQGNVAASGGYYLSAVGDKVFSTPVSITGSIGVVGGKFNVSPLLNKWGISIDRAPKKNPSPAFSAFSDFTGEHKKAIRENMLEVYGQFLRDVAIGRRRKVSEIEAHASGRVFSGVKAGTLGLTDGTGGISTALRALRDDLRVRPQDPVELVILPAVKESLFNRSLLPFGISRLMALADFAKAGTYAVETRFLMF